MADIHFTVEEAESAIPWMQRAVESMRDASADAQEAQSQLSALMDSIQSNGRESHGEEWEAQQAAIEESAKTVRAVLDEFSDRGIILRDVQRGLVDFPAMREDREVYLCWLYGETSIEYWHEVDTGFDGRQPL